MAAAHSASLPGLLAYFTFIRLVSLRTISTARERIVEFPARGDVIADGILPLRHRRVECCFVGGQVAQKTGRQFMRD